MSGHLPDCTQRYGADLAAGRLSSTLTRIKVGSDAAAATIGVGAGPVALAADGGDVWVAAGAAAGARPAGGTLRVLSNAPPSSIDPALIYPQMQAQFSAATYDTLVTNYQYDPFMGVLLDQLQIRQHPQVRGYPPSRA